MTARQVTGQERATWWQRCVAAFPDYAKYQVKTDREIPVFVLTPTPPRTTPAASSIEAEGQRSFPA